MTHEYQMTSIERVVKIGFQFESTGDCDKDAIVRKNIVQEQEDFIKTMGYEISGIASHSNCNFTISFRQYDSSAYTKEINYLMPLESF